MTMTMVYVTIFNLRRNYLVFTILVGLCCST